MATAFLPHPAAALKRFAPRPSELCQLAGRWAGTVPEHGIMAEQKVDGWRCLFFPGLDGNVGLWTRGGMPIHGAGHVLERLVQVEAALGGPHFIDGEFQVDGSLAATKRHCEAGWRLGNAGTFFAFDAVPLADWQAGRCDTPLYERKAALHRAIEATAPCADAWEWAAGSHGAGHGVDPVVYLHDVWLSDADDVHAEAQRIWRQGLEGLMLKDPMAPYVRARSDSWLKVKQDGVA